VAAFFLGGVEKIQNGHEIQKSSDLGEIWFAMAAILNPKWPPKYKNPLIWAKFGFQVDFDVAN
jgi:hypothetical protein